MGRASSLTERRDHLKSVHAISQTRCKTDLNFKAKPYVSSHDISVKWTLAYHTLFPGVPEDRVPSPWVDEEVCRPAICAEVMGKLSKYAAPRIAEIVGQHRSRNSYEDLFVNLEDEINKVIMAAGAEVNRKSALGISSLEDHAMESGNRGLKATEVNGLLTPPYSHGSSATSAEDEGYCGNSPVISSKGFPGAVTTPDLVMALEPDFDMDAKPALPSLQMEHEAKNSTIIPAALHTTPEPETLPPNYADLWLESDIQTDYSPTMGIPLSSQWNAQSVGHSYPSPPPDCKFNDFLLHTSHSDITDDPTHALDQADEADMYPNFAFGEWVMEWKRTK